MSTVDTMEPTTFTVPSGQALLYTEVSGSETLYKYKLSSGATGTVSTAILTALGVKVSELPVLIYRTNLLACLNESFATVAELTIATGTKASIDYIKKIAATKVSKSDFLTRMALTPTKSDLESGLDTKADLEYVNTALGGKADATNVYSKNETNTLIQETLAGQSAVADQATIEGTGTDTNPFTLAASVRTQLSGLETAKHTHPNATILNKITENVNGRPLYNGSEISIKIDNGSNIALDNKVDISGSNNFVGGIGLEVLSYRKLEAGGAIIQVAPAGKVHNTTGRYVDLYTSNKDKIPKMSANYQAMGLYGVPSGGTPGYIRCTKDLVTMVNEVINNSFSSDLSLYYVDPSKIDIRDGALLMNSFSRNWLVNNCSKLYWKMDTDAVAQSGTADEFYSTDELEPVDVGTYSNEKRLEKSLFNGEIYIRSGEANSHETINQVYTYNTTENEGIGFVTKIVDGNTEIERAIIKLDTSILNLPSPGSIKKPIFAAIYSANKYSVSSADGDHNTVVGLNSSAAGNYNTVFGDFSESKGSANFVSGDFSFVQGCDNIVLASNSNAYGNNNIVAGTQNITVGDSNTTHGYYGFAAGIGNELFGIGNIAIGSNNVIREQAKNTVVIGGKLDASAEDATVIGHDAKLNSYSGRFPGEDRNSTVSIRINSMDDWESRGYNKVWKCNHGGLFFGAGLGEFSYETVWPLAFHKYRVRPNIEGYFSKDTTVAARANADPYILEPFMQWTFTGMASMEFVSEVRQTSSGLTTITRNGGRIKTFDPGIKYVKRHDISPWLPVFDFDKATRWKLSTDGAYKPLPYNFVDGAEAYVVIYHGASIDWSGFTNNPNSDDGATSFTDFVWSTGSAIDASSYTSGFALVKLLVVDNGESGANNGLVCVAEVVFNNLA